MDHTSDFVRLWTRHQAEVGRYVFMMIPRQADAAEVLQDVSVLLWKKWDQYDPERPFVPWAIRFAYLEVLKWRQKLARERLVFSDSLLEQLHARYEDYCPLTEARKKALESCLEKLSEQERKWVGLRYGRHGAVKEEAARSGISMHKLYYALEKIRAQLLACITESMREEGWNEA
ncbi:sigma-70 family RNA polymerase sigma factor [Verrucomicrobiales bacterium]|jgi:RNA polymerase sigma-70 factor (ECF subfamily)|nr:sigma-70 family RNA polymerase sigma factor [Verrucomicrobiales bacterium]